MASTVWASLGVKKYQPAGLTGLGGSPANASHGSVPEISRAAASPANARIGNAEADARKRRRLGFNPRGMRSPLPVIYAIFHQKRDQRKRPLRYFLRIELFLQ